MQTVSVIIPVYNRATMIAQVIDAVLNQTYKPLEIIIVDDGSTDNLSDAVKRYPVKYIYQTNSGPAAARNTGFRHSTGEVVVFTDSDCIPKPDWLAMLLKGFDGVEIAAVAGSYDIANPQSLLARLIHEEIKWRHSFFKIHIRAFGSYNVAIKREVFKQVGGFDESFRYASGEDNELSYKILRAGYKIRFMPQALVSHYHTETLGKYLKEQYRHALWRVWLYAKHPQMSAGDDYTRLKDALEMPTALLVLLSLLQSHLIVSLIALSFALALQVPIAVRVSLQKRDLHYLAYMPLLFARSFARLAGFTVGLVTFSKKLLSTFLKATT